MAQQLGRARAQVRRARLPAPQTPAPDHPVARVAVDVGLAHLDRPFDYSVTADQHERAVPGCRVTVRFAGQQVAGFVLERVDASEHPGALQRLRRVVSPEPVLTAPVARLCRAVADHYAGTLSDVLRLAVPPRHARVEKEAAPAADAGPQPDPGLGDWAEVDGGPALLDRLAADGSPRAAWTALPGDDTAAALASAAAACLRSGRGSVLCVPDARDVARIDAALTAALGTGRHVVLTADLGPAARYRAFLAALRGRVQVVVGTRAAAFAPVRDLGLVACWDDGDDTHAEPRAPYPHVREILVHRAHLTGAAAVFAGHARTPETQLLVDSGWLAPLGSTRERVRARWPRVLVTGSEGSGSRTGPSSGPAGDPAARAARLPHDAFTVVRAGLKHGPVLLQVPRAGYRPALACQDCRAPATCGQCSGPLRQSGRGASPSCAWCGRPDDDWTCAHCGSARLRAPVVGAERTAEELGRAFPGVAVRRSAGEAVLADVPAEPALVVATPGAEPPATGGYAAAVLLDTGLLLARADLRTGEECLRRWLAVAALVRPAGDGGRLLVVGDATPAPVQALVRADPEGFASRELAERLAARLPPATRLATLEGPPDEVAGMASHDRWPPPCEVLGPVPIGPDRTRLVVRVPRAQGPALARALRAVQATRSAHKQPPVRVQLDPPALG